MGKDIKSSVDIRIVEAQALEIDPAKKYILVIQDILEDDILYQARDMLRREGFDNILLVNGDVRLFKNREEEEVND